MSMYLVLGIVEVILYSETTFWQDREPKCNVVTCDPVPVS